MQKQFVELVSNFLAEADIECPLLPGEHSVSIPIGDFRFNIGLFESQNAIVMQGIIGILPDSDREAFCIELLRMNSLFKGTRGGTLGLEGDTVTLQYIICMEDLSQKAFATQAVSFLEALAFLMEDFGHIAGRAACSAAAESAEPANPDALIMQNMIRI